MTVLVTGGAGYVGSHCVAALLEKGYDVAVADDFSKGHKAALKGGRLYEGSLLDKAFTHSIFQKEDIGAVVHFAAYSLVGESMTDPGKYFENNVLGSLRLLEAMAARQVPHLVFSSSAAVYGEPESVPILENAPTAPINPYGETKLAVEKMCRWFGTAHGIRYCALRYFNVAGAWHDGSIGEDHSPESHIIPLVLQYALGKRAQFSVYGDDYPTPDGTCIRDYVHTEDLINGHILALKYLQKGGESQAFNLGIGKGFSNREIVEAARRVTGLLLPVGVAPRRPGDPAVLVASGQRAMDTLGWKPRHTDIDGIVASAWAWHSAHPNGYDEG